MVTSLSVNFPRSARKLHVYDCQYGKNHLHDLQALLTFLERYLVAFTPPTARKPDMACLALETITLCLRILCKQFAAASLVLTLVSGMTLPEITVAHFSQFDAHHTILRYNLTTMKYHLKIQITKKINQFLFTNNVTLFIPLYF